MRLAGRWPFCPGNPHHQAAGFADTLGEVLQGILGDDLALVDDDDPLAHIRDLMEDVGGEHHGVVLAQLLDELADFDDLPGVQADRGLVEDQDLGVAHQGLGQAHPLR